MPNFAHSPIFPNKIVRGQLNPAGGATSTAALLTASTYGIVIDGPIVVYKQGSATRTIRLEIKNSTTVTVLARVALTGAQYSSINLLSPTYIPGLSSVNPRIVLQPSEILQFVVEDSNAGDLDVTALNCATYEYQA